MASNQTANIGLNQWNAEDKVLREEFNADNQKIDTALANIGDLVIETGSYVGNGTYGINNPVVLTFQNKPQIVFINIQEIKHYNTVPEYYIFFRDAAYGMPYETGNPCSLTWTDRGLSFYNTEKDPKYQYNKSGTTYHYMAICSHG